MSKYWVEYNAPPKKVAKLSLNFELVILAYPSMLTAPPKVALLFSKYEFEIWQFLSNETAPPKLGE